MLYLIANLLSMLTVAFLGPPGTYTHEAARQVFGAEVAYEEKNSIKAIFDALPSTAHVGVVPQENSIYGNVIETYDSLRTSGFICGEITLEVQHCLVGRPGIQLGEVKTVFSHEQALGQCSNFLNNQLPSATLVKTTSTATGAQAVLDSSSDCVAICSKSCGNLFGLSVLQEGIQNKAENFTRFYIITHNHEATPPCFPTRCQENRALVRISSRAPTAPISRLLVALQLIFMRIDRRPSAQTSSSHDVYFVELARNASAEPAIQWTEEVSRAVYRVKEAGGNAQLIGLW